MIFVTKAKPATDAAIERINSFFDITCFVFLTMEPSPDAGSSDFGESTTFFDDFVKSKKAGIAAGLLGPSPCDFIL